MAGAELAGHGRFYGEDHVPLNLLLSLLVENSTAFLYPDGLYRKALDGLLVTQCQECQNNNSLLDRFGGGNS